jgi:hypothetical protein
VRFKGTLILLIVCLGLVVYLYYENKGGEQREKAKQAENQIWKLESSAIRRIDISTANQQITLVRGNQNVWSISAPRSLEGDSDEINRLANAASDLRRELIVEENSANLSKFGLNPPQSSLKLKTKEGKEFEIQIGRSNPTGNSIYAMLPGKKQVFLITGSTGEAFDKKLDDLRNHSVLSFEKSEAQSLSIKSAKGDIELTKDSNDLWWLAGKEKIAADSPGIRGILNSLAMAKVKEFYVEPADAHAKPPIDRPFIDVSLVYGKNGSMKHLIIGPEKTSGSGSAPGQKENLEKLYLAKDESRSDLFYVDKELVDKLLQTSNDLRSKALAVFQSWVIDSIDLTNSKGNFKLTKSKEEWFLGDAKKKAKAETINELLEALGKKTVELIDNPAPLSKYGLDRPAARVVLKQGGNTVAECLFGATAAKGVYARLIGDPSVKVADPESYLKINIGELDLIEPPVAVSVPAAKPKK